MPPAQADVFQVSLLGYRLRITGPAPEIALLRGSFYTRAEEDAGGTPDLDLVIEVSAAGHVVRNANARVRRKPLFTGKSGADVFWWLDDLFYENALAGADELLQFHGAAAEKDGEAVLLLGDSRAGKSSMTLCLMQRGYRYLSDESIVVDPETLRVRPFPRNLMLRSEAVEEFLHPRGCRPGKWDFQEEEWENLWFFDPAKFGTREAKADAAFGQVICLRKIPEGPPALEPIGPREAAEEMFWQQLNLGELGERGLDAVVRMTGLGRNYRLSAVHPGEAWPLLRAHLGIAGDGE